MAQPRAGDEGPERSTTLIRLATELDPPEPISVARLESLLSSGHLDDVMEEVVEHGDKVLPNYDVVIVEGMVPGPEQTYSSRVNLAMAKALDASVVLVGAPGPRGLTDVDEAMAIAGDTYRSGEEVRVLGCVVNRVPDHSPETVELLRKALGRHGLILVGAVPFTPTLSRPRVLDLARAIGAQALHEGEWETRRVADVAVCAQSVPGALKAFKDDWLVLTPGDRHDVIMAACLAVLSGTRLAGLLLTVEEPHPDVWALTTAATASGLPVLLTRAPTYETAVRVHGLNPEVAADDVQRVTAVMRTVADHIDEEWVRGLTTARPMRRRLSPAAFRHRLVRLSQQADRLIVLPEGTEPRTVAAAGVCAQRGIARCLLLAPPDETRSLPDGVQVLDPGPLVERYVDALVQARRGKGLTQDAAREQLADTVVLGTMMLRQGDVDGLVSGAVHTTAATVRPALQLIKTRPGASLVSSIFFMLLSDEVVVYGDCAINPNPTAEQLADIALQSAASATAFGIEPRVAMLSYSTGESGAGSDVEKVGLATALVREAAPALAVDGPLQYDAAAVASVGRSKRPGSPVAGQANVFVFPDLNTGNTTYKAVQRGAGVVSIGPMLQGLAKPVNDLSRGALVDDIVYTIALTAIQAAAQGT